MADERLVLDFKEGSTCIKKLADDRFVFTIETNMGLRTVEIRNAHELINLINKEDHGGVE